MIFTSFQCFSLTLSEAFAFLFSTDLNLSYAMLTITHIQVQEQSDISFPHTQDRKTKFSAYGENYGCRVFLCVVLLGDELDEKCT